MIATLGLLFSTKSAGHLDRLTNALNRGHLGKFVVSPAYESAGNYVLFEYRRLLVVSWTLRFYFIGDFVYL